MGTRFSGAVTVIAAAVVLAACGGGGEMGDPATVGVSAPSIIATPNEATNASEGVVTGAAGPVWSALPGGSLLADFEESATTVGGAVSGWAYGDISVPAAYKGWVELGSGQSSSRAAALKYNLGCGSTRWIYQQGAVCGNAVRMTRSLLPSVSASAAGGISLDVRNTQASALLEVAILDSSGQSFLYRFDPRTIEKKSGSEWVSVYLPFSGPRSTSTGGVNAGALQGAIQRITITAGSSGVLVPAGEVQVDNLRVHATSNFAYDLRADAALVGGSFSPNYEGRLAVSAHQLKPEAFDKMKSVGINVIRRDLAWSYIERGGVFNFSEFDKWATALQSRGMSILWILDYGHPDHGGAAPVNSEDQAAFAEFSRRAAEHYRGKNVVGFEVWNEPNYSSYWPSTPEAFASLFQRSAAAIKSVDSSIKVISGGLAIDGIRSLIYLARLMQTGKFGQADAIGVHPYRPGKPESYAADLAPIQSILASNGVSRPLWVTEWGYSAFGSFDAALYGNGDDVRAKNRQAVLVLRSVLTQLAINSPLITVYDMVDDGSNPTDREHNFGLLEENLADKPAMTALRTLYSASRGRVFKGPLKDVPPIVHAVRWDGASDKVFALWNDTPTSTVSVTLPGKVKMVQRWDGSPVTAAGSVIKLSENDGPVFVTVSN